MEDLIREFIPNAAGLGLYVQPQIPSDKLRNAISDFAHGMNPDEVVALYDATLMGSAKDGALFGADRFIFQNTDLDSPQIIRYEDIVRVSTKRRFLSGRKVLLDVNQGRATVTLKIDFSGKPKAAQYVTRFLHEAMMRSISEGQDDAKMSAKKRSYGTKTDAEAVIGALDVLHAEGKLSLRDYERLVDALEGNTA
ncbi:MAG: hypothetical protein KDD65_14055 [Bacteroidetes bacterium]|nr:hypothetical protein [Bacteroidota bacterium]